MRRVLVVVDYQRDFVDGSLGFEAAKKLEEPISAKIEDYKSKGDEVVFTFDTHNQDYLSTLEGRKLPVEHCIEGTDGWKPYGRIEDLSEGEICFRKASFGSPELAIFLHKRAYSSVELCGVISNICVLSNAVMIRAGLPEADIFIDASCSASNNLELQDKAYDILESLNIRVLNR